MKKTTIRIVISGFLFALSAPSIAQGFGQWITNIVVSPKAWMGVTGLATMFLGYQAYSSKNAEKEYEAMLLGINDNETLESAVSCTSTTESFLHIQQANSHFQSLQAKAQKYSRYAWSALAGSGLFLGSCVWWFKSSK